jgi:RNA polymerase sigma-70 factor (ECF subfamily)
MAVGKPASKGSRAEAKDRLLVQAAQKDPSRFAELYEDNFERIYAYIARRVRDRNVAEDLTSDVFHKALAHLPSFDWRGIPFAAWLYRIAANVVADQWKRSAKEVVEDPPEGSTEMNFEAIDLEAMEHRARLFRLVDELPDDQRRVVVMRFAEEKSIRDIAQALGRTEGAVKQLQFRGLQNLRAQFDKKPGEENA